MLSFTISKEGDEPMTFFPRISKRLNSVIGRGLVMVIIPFDGFGYTVTSVVSFENLSFLKYKYAFSKLGIP